MSGYIEHAAGINERWDTLAYRYYGDANRTGPLIGANRALFIGALDPVPGVLAPGTIIRVPLLDLSGIDPETLPPWKRV